jgi:eukaryotic-like serine/threonine-protein kinase
MHLPEGQSWETIDSLLDELLDLEPDERRRRLEALPDEAPELVEPLKKLLAGLEDLHTLDGVLSRALSFLAEQDPLPVQRRLGPWRLLSEIGRGGMAQVFLAERADGAYQQQAALKLLWPGMASASVLARFEQERQILASLDDSRIARLIDGGISDDGQPWLAMEYVQGLPVDDYCDQHRLGIDERLELFCQIAAAVGAAHRRLVVHRDIKPANVLVAADPISAEEKAAVSGKNPASIKLLDFGIAKLLDDNAMPHAAPATRRAERLLTPEYASPEQLTDSPVTTASDVYQLGALLFQLLTGQPPHRRKGVSTAEFEAGVLGHSPPRPSARVRALDNTTAEAVAATRGVTPKSLVRRLRGDLDAIVAQAMAIDPEARYESADALRKDVLRVLQALPVHARPARGLYQTGKFLRRHWAGVGAAMLIAVVVMAGFAGTAWQARIAATEARKAGEIKNFLIELFEVNVPEISGGREITARELLNDGAERIRRGLIADPEIQAELSSILGSIYIRLGEFTAAEPLLREALEVRRELLGERHPDTAESLYLVGSWLMRTGDHATAETKLRQALAIQRASLDPDDLAIADTLSGLIGALRGQDRGAEAEPLILERLDIRRRSIPETDPRHGDTLLSLARYQHGKGDVAAARENYLLALEAYRTHFDNSHPSIAVVLHNLGFIAARDGNLDEAETLFRESLELKLRLLDGVHTDDTLNTMVTLSRLLIEKEQHEKAEAVLREALDISAEVLTPRHPRRALVMHHLGALWGSHGNAKEAVILLEQSLDIRREAYGSDHFIALGTQTSLARALTALGDHETARKLLLDADQRAKSNPNMDTDHRVSIELREALAELDQLNEPD